jgi:hypothetical protein
MLRRFVLFLFLVSSSLCSGQTLDSIVFRKTSLLNNIKQRRQIESYYLGVAGIKSNLCLKADSLFEICSFNEVVSFLADSSHVLKYYAFQNLASKNDTLAFEKLKSNIADTTFVFTHQGCSFENVRFNELLVREYIQFLKFKYSTGGTIGYNNKTYKYGEPNKKIWRKKRRELIQLLMKYRVDMQAFKYL